MRYCLCKIQWMPVYMPQQRLAMQPTTMFPSGSNTEMYNETCRGTTYTELQSWVVDGNIYEPIDELIDMLAVALSDSVSN